MKIVLLYTMVLVLATTALSCSKNDAKIEKVILTAQQLEGIWYVVIEDNGYQFNSESPSDVAWVFPMQQGPEGLVYPSINIQNNHITIHKELLAGYGLDYTEDLGSDYEQINNELRTSRGIVFYVRGYDSDAQTIKIACNNRWCYLRSFR